MSFPVLLARLALPAQLGGDDAEEGALLAVGQHLPRLPPLVVRGVHHVQDVAVGEGQAARWQAVVLIIIHIGPLVEIGLRQAGISAYHIVIV